MNDCYVFIQEESIDDPSISLEDEPLSNKLPQDSKNKKHLQFFTNVVKR